jgi:hypothetical protein
MRRYATSLHDFPTSCHKYLTSECSQSIEGLVTSACWVLHQQYKSSDLHPLSFKASLYPLVFVDLRRPRCLSKLYTNRLRVVSDSLLRIYEALAHCSFVHDLCLNRTCQSLCQSFQVVSNTPLYLPRLQALPSTRLRAPLESRRYRIRIVPTSIAPLLSSN